MACDANVSNDTHRTNISLEDDKDNARKHYFETGLNALLANPNFLLLYVPDNGTKMRIIRPASNVYHRNRMIERINEAKYIPSFYYALSHLWGLSENNRYLWNGISEYVDDEEGIAVKPVSMRPEKRCALLKLLKVHPDSYWWIDVLCARTETPLDIMGDIYSCCLECVVMIDCEPSLIPKIHAMHHSKMEIEELYRTKEYIAYEQICQTEGLQLTELLYTFFQSRWWKRVWTWQEMALPMGNVRFMAETDTHQLQTNTITREQLLGFEEMAYIIVFTLNRALYYNQNELHGARHVDDRMLKLATEVHLDFEDIGCARSSINYRISGNKRDFAIIIASLMYSTRRCYDPADYVYGVLGMMRIKIPRMSDPNAVWWHLLSKLDDLVPLGSRRWIDRAHEIDLRKVQTLGDVFSKVLDVYNGTK